jgi:hypothetical protein
MPETIVAAIHQTERLGTLSCALMHDSTMWPIHGEYRCRTCGRHYPVPWAAETMVPIEAQARLRSVER